MNKLRIGIIGCGIQGKFYRDIIDGGIWSDMVSKRLRAIVK